MRSELESLREIERCARGVVRTAARDEIYEAVVPAWWEALVSALENPRQDEEIEEENPCATKHIHMTSQGFWEGEQPHQPRQDQREEIMTETKRSLEEWDEQDIGGEG